MGYTISFAPNISYNAEAFNALGGDFMTTENTSFVDGVSYGVSDLNEIRSDIVTAGIAKGVGRSCSCSIIGSTIKVAAGREYFANGIRAVIDDDGLTVAYTPGASGNVWLKYDDVLCEMSLQFTVASPNGICVKIATVSGGTVNDCREYCCMKNPSLLPNRTCSRSVEIEITSASTTIPVKTITVDAAGYKYMHVKNASTYTLSDFSALVGFSPASVAGACNGRFNYGVTCKDASKGFCVYATEGSSGANATYLRAELSGDQLKFYVTEMSSSITVMIDLLLF